MDANAALPRRTFDAAVAAADPDRWLKPAIAALERPAGRVKVLSLGKAAIPMARTFAGAFDGRWAGLAVAPSGEGAPVEGFRVLEGAHPVPDERSLAAGEAALAFAAGGGPEDLLLVLISGGASAVACAPIAGVPLHRKVETTRRLLASGASIAEINTVRRACSRLKGGGLLRATQAGRVLTIAMSDVPGDGLADIGSGPAVPNPTNAQDAIAVLRSRAPDLAAPLAQAMRIHAAKSAAVRTPWRAEVGFRIGDAAEAAFAHLRGRGVEAHLLGAIAGDAAQTASVHAGRLAAGQSLVSGGELSVPVPDGASGRGGRNQHYLLALAIGLAGRGDVWALAADTDGKDGSSDAAGAWVDPALLGELDVEEAHAALAAFDAHGFFERHGRLLRTGPTGVNVGDLRLALVDPPVRA